MRYFITVAQAGSFYGAAKRLDVSQQGLNKAVSSLEAELGTKLLERGRRGVFLTEEGRRFLECAQRVTAEYGDYLAQLFRPGSSREGHELLPVYVSYYSAQIAAATQEYVDLLMSTTYLEEPFEKVVARARVSTGDDLCFVDLHANAALELLSSEELAFDPMIATRIGVVCRKEHPLAKRRALRRGELAGYACATNSNKELQHAMDWLFRDHPLGNVRMSVANPRMLLRFVLAAGNSEGVAIYDSFGFHLAQRDPGMPTEGLVFVPLSTPEALCHVGFLYPKHTRLKPRVLHSVNLLSRFLQQHYSEYLERHPLSGLGTGAAVELVTSAAGGARVEEHYVSLGAGHEAPRTDGTGGDGGEKVLPAQDTAGQSPAGQSITAQGADPVS